MGRKNFNAMHHPMAITPQKLDKPPDKIYICNCSESCSAKVCGCIRRKKICHRLCQCSDAKCNNRVSFIIIKVIRSCEL